MRKIGVFARFRAECLVVLLSAFCVQGVAHATVTDLINERLSHMRDVAAWKWLNERPIEDFDRENVVLERSVVEALRYGITAASSERLFRAQIEAAKEIQRYWFERWERGRPPQASPDLNQTIRPELLKLGDAIVSALAGGVDPARGDIRARGLSKQTAQEILESLAGIEYYPDRLTQILDSGRLRIGTTGDYAPFSSGLFPDALKGIDIDLAHDLAESLGVKIDFVVTSWPTLLADLDAGRFDVAMSGISRSLHRTHSAYLSQGYLVGGKAAIARCDRAQSLDSLAAIDRSGVVVVVNPGGTNQRYVEENVRNAQVVVHGDNRTIFDELIAGRADVMITDRIEVTVQSTRHPELCPTLSENLTYQEKAVLIAPDQQLKHYVDTWLSLRVGAGVVDRLVNEHTGR